MNMLFYHWVMPVIYIMCVLAFLLFAYDKHCAVYSKFRIPEWVLVLVFSFFTQSREVVEFHNITAAC